MKKASSLLLIFTVIISVCRAQIDSTENSGDMYPLNQQNIDTEENLKTKIGAMATFGFHRLAGTSLVETNTLYGAGMGMYHLISLNKSKTVQVHYELSVGFKGSNYKSNVDTGYSRISLGYVQLPVGFNFQINRTGAENPVYLYLGAQGSVLVHSKIFKGQGEFRQVLYNNLDLKKLDFSPMIGFQLGLGSGMYMQIMYKYGLTNINTPEFNKSNYPNVFPALTGEGSILNRSLEISFQF